MSYQVRISQRALKKLSKTGAPNYERLKKTIKALANDPRPPGCLKLKGRDAYRVRVGNYRIIYEILDKKLTVIIIELGHRKDIYS